MATQTIGRYQIKSEIGRGGMATVYHAYDPNFERDVAIKVLPAAFLHDPQFRGRFEREAKMIALLEHPAIVPVYDFGEQDGQPYIVMRYMAGGSLAERLKEGALPYEDTAQLVSRLAPALDVAHKRGIIHRDLKPGNILFDQYGNSFLSDFGIARLVQSGVTTMTGESIVGTPAYMSPEQIQGDKSIDGRSDIYAMGVLIYQMLTGEAPYRADTPAKVMMMHILEPVPDLQAVDTSLPNGCSSVILRAMAKDPDDRYKTTADLAGALQAVTREIDTKPAQEDENNLFSAKTMVAAPAQSIPSSAPGATLVADPSKAAAPQPAAPPQTRRARIPVMLIVILVLIGGGALVFGGLYLMGRQGNGPLAMFASAPATATNQPSATSAQPTNTLPPDPTTAVPQALTAADTPQPASPTPTATAPPSPTWTPTSQVAGPVIAGADKIGFLNGGDIYIANLDGSQLKQLTEDGTQKFNLQWSPDGLYMVYISGKCVYRVGIEGGPSEMIACFNRSDALKAFEISPDGLQAAISLDNQMFIVPLDWTQLAQATTRGDLASLAVCPEFGPYERNFITEVRWSQDAKVIAAKLIGNLGDGRRGDIIQVFNVDRCIDNPRALDNFPASRFEMRGYNKTPVIPSYAWDGSFLFALNNTMRNDGFGDLYIYNMELHKADELVNPIADSCCYRDMQWSPDGTHLLFAFQNITDPSNAIQLYLIPYGTIGTGAQYEPIPLPAITNPREKPQPVLRPAR
ncbi:MAG TPA: protein kinase [Anaerolineales bacterium]|nr:protein kinase [Anaerolineales bacterium]